MLTISTDSLKGYGLNRIFEFAKNAGYEGIDLVIDPLNYDTQNSEYLQALIAESGIPIVSVQTPTNCNPKKVEKAVEICKKIKCDILIIQPPKLFEFKYIAWLKREVPKIREKENLSIAMENAPSSNFLGIIPDHAMDNISSLREFQHVCIDTSRVAQKNQDIIRIYKALKKFIVQIHLSNVKSGQSYHLPDKGILPLESLLAKMKQDNFEGHFSLKVLPKFLAAGDDEKVLSKLIEAKKFYLKYFYNLAIDQSDEEDTEGTQQ
jgi:sugar phosphate isomerase/epimerase